MIILCVKCCLSLITVPDTQLMICIFQIKFNESSDFYQLIQSFTNKRQCMMIFYYNFIQCLIVDTEMKAAIPLEYEKY